MGKRKGQNRWGKQEKGGGREGEKKARIGKKRIDRRREGEGGATLSATVRETPCRRGASGCSGVQRGVAGHSGAQRGGAGRNGKVWIEWSIAGRRGAHRRGGA